MFTEFHFNVGLVQDVPNNILDILRFMISEDREKDESLLELPSHPLFDTTKWKWMLLCDSRYFSAETISTLYKANLGKDYYLCIRCNLKNYDNEIEKFVDWVNPYIDAKPNAFLGFSRYEKSENPDIIRKK